MSIGIYNYNIILSSFKGTVYVFPSTLLNCPFLPLFTVGQMQAPEKQRKAKNRVTIHKYQF